MALKFDVCVTSLIRNWPNLQEKDQIWNFHDLLDARQHSQKTMRKKKKKKTPSSLTIIIESIVKFFL